MARARHSGRSRCDSAERERATLTRPRILGDRLAQDLPRRGSHGRREAYLGRCAAVSERRVNLPVDVATHVGRKCLESVRVNEKADRMHEQARGELKVPQRPPLAIARSALCKVLRKRRGAAHHAAERCLIGKQYRVHQSRHRPRMLWAGAGFVQRGDEIVHGCLVHQYHHGDEIPHGQRGTVMDRTYR